MWDGLFAVIPPMKWILILVQIRNPPEFFSSIPISQTINYSYLACDIGTNLSFKRLPHIAYDGYSSIQLSAQASSNEVRSAALESLTGIQMAKVERTYASPEVENVCIDICLLGHQQYNAVRHVAHAILNQRELLRTSL